MRKSFKKLKKSEAELTPWEKAQKKRQQQKKHQHHKNDSRSFVKKLPQTNKLRKQRLAKGTVQLIVIFGVLFVSSLFFILPFSRILSVNVNTNDAETRLAVIKASDLHYYESLIGVWPQTSKIEQRIHEKVPSVKKAKIQYEGSHVIIDIQEYPTIGYVMKGNKYYKLTSSGMIDKYGANSPSGNYPVFYNFKNNSELKEMTHQYDKLSKNLQKGISEIHSEPTKADPGKIKLYMNDGNQVIASTDTFAQKMQYYPNIVSKMNHTGIVDLEVGAYSYPYGKN